MDILVLQNIYANYGKKEVLRGIDLNVTKGEIIALIGPNGAGKSTLLKSIIGLVNPLCGEIYFQKKIINKLPVYKRVQSGISYFVQGGKVFPDLTVKENLQIDVAAFNYQNQKNGSRVALDIFPNLAPLLDRRAGLLSGGERQALAFAMVIAHEPQILLLDEPSAGLSPKLVSEMLAKVREINQKLCTTILIVEQNVGEALKISHKVYLMQNGKLQSHGTPEEIQSNGRLEELFMGLENKHQDNPLIERSP
jgi:branched-chain amino acid transport system ATP-binding protein